MSNLLTVESLNELASVHQPPCLSIYQPTHRRHPENQQDPIRFRNLAKQLDASLRQKYPAIEAQSLLQPFGALAQNHDFWNHTLDGLAVLSGPGLFRVFRLPRPVAELAVVADSFHTNLPLLSEPQPYPENTMQIQINTDRNVEGRQALSAHITGVVESALSRFSDHITRVEVHVSDENGDKTSKDDMRCMMEARLEGRQPVAVTEQAATLDQAVDGAADKLARMLDSTLGRQRDRQRQGTNPPAPEPPIPEQK